MMSIMQEIALYYKDDYKKYLIAYDILTYNHMQLKKDLQKRKITKKQINEVIQYIKENYYYITKNLIDYMEKTLNIAG